MNTRHQIGICIHIINYFQSLPLRLLCFILLSLSTQDLLILLVPRVFLWFG